MSWGGSWHVEKLNIFICDDELIERVLIRKLLNRYTETVHMQAEITECASGDEFLKKLREQPADIVLLDIYMPDMTGIDLARQIRAMGLKSQIIFITSGNEYAAEAFEVGTLSYLQKPVLYEKFKLVMDLAMQHYARTSAIEIFMNRESWKIYISDITYMETLNRKLIIHTGSNDYTTYMTLGKMLEQLPVSEFVQISRFEVVALHRVRTMDSRSVVLTDGTELQISSKYAEQAFSSYEAYRSNGR
jgi:DNA-binding LytR/AlgR family response regulator